ncbi:Formylglycine-generating enzyme, required for sulfatase activity, contains SUMF1/FGE domain [Microbulbifer donghaiensis]|uniref:Formylglycine-generating enzyme, required for sulfatase activity, contains SUMF1/FGE domain n=1 Tax=Microbulbifer donghaiensis TaxID=494016 RepID=A0A1M5D319_9GAMM|nr:PEGA domain-containing protein [Microbulbifer donghaiensis]SHF61366.1 Formylglycine-generating enzyme, required for sulfatase activity, contains SUMF1/FGE domain [Microbulbifer donghaiensis]
MTAKEAVPVRDNGPAEDDFSIIEPAGFIPVQVESGGKRLLLSPRALTIAGSLLLGMLALVYLLVARSLIFETQPADADVSVSGLALPLGDGHLVLPGHYSYTISASGYLPKSGEVDVSSDGHSRHVVALEKKPGHLQVVSDPPVALRILVNGSDVPSENGLAKNIPAGTKRITVVTDRYLPYTREVEIEGLDNTQRLQAKLRPAWANVRISSNPPGATVSVGGEVLGTTPLNAELIQGDRQVSLSLPEYKTVEIPVAVTAGVDQTLAPVDLSAADGLLRVVSKPEGAGVTVDGEFRGHTPLELELSSGGQHQLRFFKDGYASVERTIDVDAGVERDLNITLDAVYGRVRISSSPADAQVFIDGRLAGVTGETFNLPARSHSILVRKSGYVDYETSVVPSSKLEQTIRAVLLTADEARWSRIPTEISHPAGGVMKLMRPNAHFTMGSSRREQGRRANEVLRQVALDRPFYLGTTEVTNREFRRFRRMHSSSHVNGVSLDNDNLPVVNVSWSDAAMFCNWLSERDGLSPVYLTERGSIVGFDAGANGYRLPTEAEWAWAARYEQGAMRKFPWGDELPVRSNSGNYADNNAAQLVPAVLRTYSDRYAATAPVATYSPNSLGLHDLGGNVSEWIHDLYTIGTGLSMRREENPVGPQNGDYHVIRGSSWRHAGLTELRLSYRDYGAEPRNDVGFRIARWVN